MMSETLMAPKGLILTVLHTGGSMYLAMLALLNILVQGLFTYIVASTPELSSPKYSAQVKRNFDA